MPPSSRIQFVHNFDELASTPFRDGINALCWPRALPGDFAEVVQHITTGDGITTLDEATLAALPLTPAGRTAADILIHDLARLRDRGLAPVLDCIHGYPRDDDDLLPTHVYSFHADRAPIEADTWLCTYHGAPSEALRNEDATRCADIPELRAALLHRFGGPDDAAFLEHLREFSYDLHYASAPGAQPIPFGVGHLWRIAIEYPGCPVPPCIHRAPAQPPGDPPRLLLIS